ncbi:hypothetical protein DCC39_02830 [Pueribacillus theae]|uniref:Uncharacterized protein n=1 Tax=Pueribacillus theae TaxID=2171751 RepID=A0A2U1K7E5_9BACI|nr:hypothetical protein [Pueribacillus theae]PWA13079.1 hypothetical protein DCC39_02830 [Pueribacillus theae]
MKQITKLSAIGIIAGIVLALFLKVVQLLTGSEAYILLFNMDYIPVLKEINEVFGMGMLFHFATCIGSVVILFFILKGIHLEHCFLAYLAVYTIGGAILFALAGLTETPPAVTDLAAWCFWTAGHALFGAVVGLLIKYWA